MDESDLQRDEVVSFLSVFVIIYRILHVSHHATLNNVIDDEWAELLIIYDLNLEIDY